MIRLYWRAKMAGWKRISKNKHAFYLGGKKVGSVEWVRPSSKDKGYWQLSGYAQNQDYPNKTLLDFSDVYPLTLKNAKKEFEQDVYRVFLNYSTWP